MIKTGFVLFFNGKKDLGLIKSGDNEVYFFNKSSINNGIIPIEGEIVSFQYKKGNLDTGLVAFNIKGVQ